MYLGRSKPTETTSSVLRSTYTGNGSTTTYALPGPVANETSIIATINGVTQQDAAYSTDGSNIIFDAAPASGDSIELRTLSAVAMSYAPMAGSVVTGTIADGAVTTGKIADNSITTAKIAAGAVVQADLATNVVGTGPAFSASGTTSVSSSTLTTLTFGTEQFDTNNNFASNTFTPTVAGYYQINFGLSWASAPAGQAYCQLRKNNTFYSNAVQSSGAYLTSHNGSVLLYMNGSTDYLTVICAQFGGTTISADTVINGCLMRSA